MYKVLLPIESDEQRPTPATRAVAELPGDPDEIAVTVLNVFEEFDVYDDMGGSSSDQLYDDVDLPAGVRSQSTSSRSGESGLTYAANTGIRRKQSSMWPTNWTWT
ncbi:hypothetical protein [Natrinema soli]|uniref:Uncharacterized protein n=1 Tax=Natrinema soli TaxID=1930624 RepID=A0ABD5SND3_9EURY|nr:hypothetical protein [Natrinema soli]